MAIRFRCPHCPRVYRVADAAGGRQVRCKQCRRRILIPEAVPGTTTEEGPGASTTTRSGPLIERHGPRQRAVSPAIGDADSIEQITAHIEQHVGPIATVYHELISDLVHIDIHLVEPTRTRPFHTLITSGMSDLPMLAPAEAGDCRFAELVLSLPPDWPLTQEAFADERHYWPMRWLKLLARFPHEYATWLWYGHTIPNGDPPQAFAPDTDLCCALLLLPQLVPEEFHTLSAGNDKSICFLSLVPLYAEEMEYKLEYGTEALVERFAAQAVTELLDVQRKNVCAKKRWPF